MELQTIKYSELSDVKKIAEGGFGVVHRSKHPHLETVVYKELKSDIIPDGSKSVLYSGLFAAYISIPKLFKLIFNIKSLKSV